MLVHGVDAGTSPNQNPHYATYPFLAWGHLDHIHALPRTEGLRRIPNTLLQCRRRARPGARQWKVCRPKPPSAVHALRIWKWLPVLRRLQQAPWTPSRTERGGRDQRRFPVPIALYRGTMCEECLGNGAFVAVGQPPVANAIGHEVKRVRFVLLIQEPTDRPGRPAPAPAPAHFDPFQIAPLHEQAEFFNHCTTLRPLGFRTPTSAERVTSIESASIDFRCRPR